MSEPWGWASSVGEFLAMSRERWLSALVGHHERLLNMPPAESQLRAWREEYDIVFGALKLCVTSDHSVKDRWSVAFEYELPLEGGRRPDVVVLNGGSVTVLEFKSKRTWSQPDVDQTLGYIRDLHDYHSGSAGRPCAGMLVLAGAKEQAAVMRDGIPVGDATSIPRYLMEFASDGTHDLGEWLHSEYEPLPTLVEAARRIFRDEPLPHVKTALSAGIPQALEVLGSIVDRDAETGSRSVAFVTGVPGAGKTLVGLRLVHERAEMHGRATFLSGNGPLVQVLQDALDSKVFVRDLHQFIKTYALNKRKSVPSEHVVVFDEAQRAWDEDYMHEKKSIRRSEPSLLLEIGSSIDRWSTLIGLVGEGQEIHSGEEAGLSQWRDAVVEQGVEKWSVHCSPRVSGEFEGTNVQTHDHLDLTVSLRSRRAKDLHEWVRRVLEGSFALANPLAKRIKDDHFPLYITRSIETARSYAKVRYVGEPAKRFGLLASSHAKNLEALGIYNGYQATKILNIAKWFNADSSDDRSSNALRSPITEFMCQGLEVDLPIVCWGSDVVFVKDQWRLTPIKRRYPQQDPKRLLTNAYRVLLTRGRDGLVVFLPPDETLDGTEKALLASGMEILTDEMAEGVDVLAHPGLRASG
jgi:hypothetical protein